MIFLHILVLVYWVGADIGVLYGAHFATNAQYSRETRLTVAQIMGFIDQFPRLSLPMIVTTGTTVAVLRGYMPIDPLWLLPVWLIGLFWAGMVLALYLNRRTPQRVAALAGFEPWFRLAIALALILAGLASLFGVGITDQGWLAVKLILFAGTIFAALALRKLFDPFRDGMRALRAGTNTAADDAMMRKALIDARPAVWAIWVLALAAAYIGIWQPVF